MEHSNSRESSEPLVDPAHPFKGVVVCCTSIPPDQRTEIAKKTEELGGVHKYDLTPDVTHLIVGDYDTPKYRHVAKERTDIKAMDATWIDALGQLWMADADIDFPALEREHQLKPLETCGEVPDATNPAQTKRGSLLLCMTGFDDPDQRNLIISRIQANGGTYTGDLTKRVSHLIVHKPEGKKYKAARNWGIRTVSLAWLDQTIERGMVLDEQCFDPVLPPEEQGQGAWNRASSRRVSLGKRSRSGAGEGGQRKLRKTASMKLSSQRDTLWGDILGSKPTAESSVPDRSERIEVRDSGIHDAMVQPAPEAGIFSGCYFFMAGFESWKSKILAETIGSLGGRTFDTFGEVVTEAAVARSAHRFLIVPQESQPSTHFQVPPAHLDQIQIVTEFFVERCLHNKALCDPNSHVLGRPFPMFPIRGFENLYICTAGFTGVDLLHVEKAIRQIGAKYAARLNEVTSVLVCKSLAGTRKEKLKFAYDNDIPIVSSDWLWDSITTGYNAPVKAFMFPELQQDHRLEPKPRARGQHKEETKQAIQRTRSEPIPHMPKKPASRHPSVTAIDPTAFQDGNRPKSTAVKYTNTKEDSAASFQFQTAKTHQMDSFGGGTVAAQPSEKASDALNKSHITELTAKPLLARTTSVADSMDATPISGVEARYATEEESQAAEVADEVSTRTEPDAPTALESGAHEENEELGRPAEETKEHPQESRDDNETQQGESLGWQETSTEDRPQSRKANQEMAAEDDQDARLKAQREAQKKAEREDLSSRLTNLIESKGSGTGAETLHDDEQQQQQHQQQQQQRRPRKRIFGRAISNASAASSGSAESRMDALGRPAEDQEQQEQEPASTQIQYQDPGAQQHRAKIMSRMLGEDVKAPAMSQGPKTKIGGFEFDGEASRLPRRQTRRNF
ncbi:brct domain-containing protein [Colletotrichum truncatum]|uniref:Brct domain-containing protein n=1 Tax=Colletotrichum truncatum TaxID=5467 RepID=A0ACC3YHX2_COLTU|nr:brct domain-containing protein [Colletotrichum truncatum]KAF6786030.1 brct domain-containing protein [Colletotrichum truncatum]